MRICKANDCENDLDEAGRASHAKFCSDRCRTQHKDWSRNVHKTAQIPLRVKHETKDRIEREAAARGVTMTWLVTKLIEEGLERMIPADEFSLTRKDA